MAHTFAHFAIVLAVLLSLSCSAIAGRRELIASGATAVKRYVASASTLASSNRALTGSCSLRADVVAGIPVGKSATVTAAGFYRVSTGALVKAIPCTAKADTATGTWSCDADGGAQLTSAYVPIDPISVSAGVYASPSSFYFSVKVDGVEVKGKVVASIGRYYVQ
ncbi:unnamed protein product [Closterium sp. Yama58-4]|nr:unnamed protein product [Closterium sp. Yama58-4]